MLVTLDLDLPEGFKATGEYRNPKEGEWFVSDYQDYPVKAKYEINVKRIILRKDEPPKFPMFFGCIKNRVTGQIAFVTRVGLTGRLEGVCSDGSTMTARKREAELYDHPDYPNSKELLSFFGW